jgi:hypothetical protein
LSSQAIEALKRYYSKTTWPPYFLKETLRRIDEATVNRMIKEKLIIGESKALELDGIFLNEAEKFLELSVWNFLVYKFLMSGPYLSWAYTTRYFADFYAVNALLRIRGNAVVHIERRRDEDWRYQTVHIARSSRAHAYRLNHMRTNEHEFVWNTFFTLYRGWDYKTYGIFHGDDKISQYVRKERANWNYDVFFASQSMDIHAKEEARIMALNNFLDTHYVSLEHAEFMEEHGWEERVSGEFIKATLDILGDIASEPRLKDHHIAYLKGLRKSIEDVQSNESTKENLIVWVEESLNRLNVSPQGL